MRSPGLTAAVSGIVAIGLALVAQSLIQWGATVSWWVRIPVVAIVLTIMLAASIVAGISVQDYRIMQRIKQLPPNGKTT